MTNRLRGYTRQKRLGNTALCNAQKPPYSSTVCGLDVLVPFPTTDVGNWYILVALD